MALWLESWLESLFGVRGTVVRHVPRFLAIEVLVLFGKFIPFLICELLKLSTNSISLHFCSIYSCPWKLFEHYHMKLLYKLLSLSDLNKFMPPARTTEFTPSKRGWILALHDLEYSYQKIAFLTNTFVRACHYTVTHENQFHIWQSPLI